MRLAKREKYLASLAACAVALFLVFQFVLFPFLEKRERLVRGIAAREQGLKELVTLASQYEHQKRNQQRVLQTLARRKDGFTLFSFLEKRAGEAGVKDRIKYMKPSTSPGVGPLKESTVEMKLEAVTFGQLVEYLYHLESSQDLITIQRLSIRKSKADPAYLDAVLSALTFD